MRGRGLDRSWAPVGLQRRAEHESPSGVADPGPAVPNLDAVGAGEPRMVRLETFVRQPGGPATGFAQVDSQDPPRQAFACEQRLAIRVKSTTVDEDRVGKIGPVLHRTVGTDFPYVARALAKGPTGCPPANWDIPNSTGILRVAPAECWTHGRLEARAETAAGLGHTVLAGP